MSTFDIVLVTVQVVMTVVSAGLGIWMLVAHRRRPGGVRVFRRPVRSPQVMAAAYFSFALGFAADAASGIAGSHPALSALSLLGKVSAVVFLVVNATRSAA
jgi:hypothetical protein